MRGLRLCIVALSATTSCTTSYQPMATPRVAIVQDSGKLAFVRSGKQYDIGFFGGGLEEAVSGVPEAESHAKAYGNIQVGGFVFVLGGLASYGGAIAAYSSVSDDESPDLSTGNALLLGGLALTLTGAIIYAHGPPHLLDAVNIHNDAIQRDAVEKWRQQRKPAPAGAP